MAKLLNTHTFQKGMVKDSHPKNQPSGTYRDAMNMVRNPDADLQSEGGWEATVLFQDGYDNDGNLVTGDRNQEMRYIGGCQLGKDFIMFWSLPDGSNWEIGLYTPQGYRTKITTLNTRHQPIDATEQVLVAVANNAIPFTDKPIDCVARVRLDNEQTVYFTSHEIGIRSLNLTDLSSYTTTNLGEQSSLLFSYNAPTPQLDFISEDGSLLSGVYHFLLRYRTSDGSPTPFGAATNPIPVVQGSKGNGRFGYIGADPNTPTNKSINLRINGLDPNYPFYELAVAYYEGEQSVPRYFSLPLSEIQGRNTTISYKFSSLDQLREETTLEELVQGQAFYSSARCVSQKDNRLFLSNLKSIPEADFQSIANNIKLRYFIEEKNVEDPISFERLLENQEYYRHEILADDVVRIYLPHDSQVADTANLYINRGDNIFIDVGNEQDPENNGTFRIIAANVTNRTVDILNPPAVSRTIDIDSGAPVVASIAGATGTITSTSLENAGVSVGDYIRIVSDSSVAGNAGYYKVSNVDDPGGVLTVGNNLENGTSLSDAASTNIEYHIFSVGDFNILATRPYFDPASTGPSTFLGFSIYSQDNKGIQNFTDYIDEKVAEGERTYRRGEVYSFAFVPVFKNGTSGFAYHIPAPNTGITDANPSTGELGTYISNLLYPTGKGYPSPGFGVRHHKMPTIAQEPLIRKDGNLQYLRILGVSFYDIDIPDHIKESLSGYYIVRQRRDNEENTSILYQGIIKKGINVPNNLVCLPGGFGRVSYQDAYTSGSNFAQGNFSDEFCMGYFPDLIHKSDRAGTPNALRYEKTYVYEVEHLDTRSHEVHTLLIQKSELDDSLDTSLSEGDQVTIDEIREISPGSVDININNKRIKAEQTNGGHLLVVSTGGSVPIAQSNPGDFYDVYNSPLNINWGMHIDLLSSGELRGTDLRQIRRVACEIHNLVRNNSTQYGEISNAGYVLVDQVVFGQPRAPKTSNFGNGGTTRPAGHTDADGHLLDSVVDVFGGDTFISKYGLTIIDTFDGPEATHNTMTKIRFGSVMYFWVESNENYNYRHFNPPEGNVYSSENFTPGTLPFYPAYRNVGDLINGGGLMDFDVRLGHSTGYNKQYGYENSLELYFTRPLIFTQTENFPLRTIWSEMAIEGQESDKYREILPNNFTDQSGEWEYIASTFILNDILFLHTPRALLRSFVNETTQQSSSSGEIFTSSSGIMTIPAKRIGEGSYGHGGTTSLQGGATTPQGRFFPDPRAGKMFLFNGQGLTEISLQGMEEFFREEVKDVPDHPNQGTGYSSVYDPENSRWICCIHKTGGEKTTVSYHTKLQSWSSRHSYDFIGGFWDSVGFQLTKNFGLRKGNQPSPGNFDTLDSCWVQIATVFPKSGGEACVYDTVEVSIDKIMDNGAERVVGLPTHMRAFTYKQHSGRRNLVQGRENIVAPEDHYVSWQDRRMRMAVPQDRVVNQHISPIDADANLDFTNGFPQRIRDEFMFLELENDNESGHTTIIRYIRVWGRNSYR